MNMKVFSTPFLTLAAAMCFVAFIAWSRIPDYPTEFSSPVVPSSLFAPSPMTSFPVTPSTPIALGGWSFSVGSYSFGITDCATEFIGDQFIGGRYTLVQFGKWSAFFAFHAQHFSLAVATVIAALFAIACFRQLSSRREQQPRTRNA